MVRTFPARTAGVVLLCALLAACGSGDSAGPASAPEGPWAVIDSLDSRAFVDAAGREFTRSHSRLVRLEQWDDHGVPTARRESVVAYSASDSTVQEVARDSVGTFGFGMFDRIVSDRGGVPGAVDLTPYVLPDDAPYLSPRNRERYEITMLPDTTLRGHAVRRIEVRAHPDLGTRETIRRVRFTVVEATGALVAVLMERRDPSLLFTEESRLYVERRVDPDGSMRPYLSVVETGLRTRIGADHRFRVTTSWFDQGPG